MGLFSRGKETEKTAAAFTVRTPRCKGMGDEYKNDPQIPTIIFTLENISVGCTGFYIGDEDEKDKKEECGNSRMKCSRLYPESVKR